MCFGELSVIGEMFNACSGWGVCACGFIGDADRFIRLMLFSFICMGFMLFHSYACSYVCAC